MFAPSGSPAQLSSTLQNEFEHIIHTLTKRLLRTIYFLVLIHSRNIRSTRVVTVVDVQTAVDLLSLPRSFADHFSTLPNRISDTVAITGSKTYNDLTGEKIDEILSRVGKRRRADSRREWPEEWDRDYGFKWDSETID